MEGGSLKQGKENSHSSVTSIFILSCLPSLASNAEDLGVLDGFPPPRTSPFMAAAMFRHIPSDTSAGEGKQ
jgi:hypothetical protein